jgi:hypothetical protein
MTTQSLDTINALDLSDLDALDDHDQHIFCLCTVKPNVMMVAEALCGKEALCYGRPVDSVPMVTCEPCRAIASDVCPRCGE